MKRAAGMSLLLMLIMTVSLSAQNIAPVADHLVVIGEARPGMTIWASYVYNDADDPQGNSIIRWYSASDQYGNDTVPIASATGDHYLIKDSDFGSWLGFIVIPVAQGGPSPGNTAMTSVFTEVLENKAPEARNRSITGTLNVGDVLTGLYTYYDYENDYESGSVLKWYGKLASESTWTQLGSGISYKIKSADQRKYFRFGIIPKAITGTDSYTEVFTAQVGPANSAPYAQNVKITGADKNVGTELTGEYNYRDDDPADHEGGSTFQWFRGTEPITGATTKKYTPGEEDAGLSLIFKVTPVTAGTGNPVIGEETASLPYGPIMDPSAGPPTATQLCIDGYMISGNLLKGRYLYSGLREKNSKYYWYVNDLVVDSGLYNSSYGYAKYTLEASDIGKKIQFAVIPQDKTGALGAKVMSPAMALFSLPLQDHFSVTEPSLVLAGNPSGGVFSGPGESVSGNSFYPSKLATSDDPYTLAYLLPVHYDSIQCTQTVYKKVWVQPVVVTLSGLNAYYCDGNGKDTVHVSNLPLGASSCAFKITDAKGNPASVTKINDIMAVFNPDSLNSGEEYIFTYSYTDVSGLPYSKPQNFIVDHIGKVKISNLKADTTFCNDTKPFELFTTPSGGTFTGPVINTMLNITGISGKRTVTYTITSAYCSKSDVVPITVFNAPSVSFIPEDFCITDITSDSTRMINNTTPIDSVSSWLWEFTEGGVTTKDTNRVAAYLYRTGGSKKIYLTATTLNNCVVRKDESFDLGVKPKADFRWEKDCYHPGTSICFFDATEVDPNVAIKSRSWDFNHGDSILTVENPVYPQKAVGPISVRYTVTTAYAGCDDEISKTVYIKPTIDLASDDYYEDFEDGKSDWALDDESVNNWKFGTPDRSVIKGAASGDSAWYTGFRTDTVVVESSSVISPCFDFTGVDRPMISLDLWKRLERNHQGAALQYKIGDADGWEYVGTLEDGIKWYNSALIKGRPGGEQIGWTSIDTPDAYFYNSRHKLDELHNTRDVKFRIAYGSDGSTEDDGLAFDNIWIGSRSRKVLVEHFTNTSSKASSTANTLVDTIARRNPDDVIYIQYHTNFPGNDPYYNDNQGDASARILFYGLSRAPYSFLDGGSDQANYASLYDYNVVKIDSNEVSRRSLINTLFDIDISADATEGVLTVNGQIKALADVSAENMTLYLAVTEKENNEHMGANGETLFWNVFRKMIPDAGGIDLKKSWIKNETYSIPAQSWMIENIRDNSQIEVVAFLQNNVTRVVYQAASVRDLDIGVGILDLPGAGKLNFALYPNPAVNRLTLDFREPLAGDVDIKIYDLQGNIVSTYLAGSDRTQFTIDNLNLKQGIYLVRISRKGLDLGFRKLVIA